MMGDDLDKHLTVRGVMDTFNEIPLLYNEMAMRDYLKAVAMRNSDSLCQVFNATQSAVVMANTMPMLEQIVVLKTKVMALEITVKNLTGRLEELE